ncbi:N-glycosidase YbiA [Ditylenchus destructor]|uniref:N-glycosidase YbiA n=1 Tax=Ditylenchus destructor TaxID=166010 RepID=A0AAD4QVU0_9BILA|nr:N-glycosidase YbiA [Ditylenchus destructor]
MTQPYNIGVKKVSPDGTEIICFFTKKFIYSNFYLCNIEIDGKILCCSEQYYMFQKAKVFKQPLLAESIMNCAVPAVIKNYGRDVEKAVKLKTGKFDYDQWHKIAIQIMMIACLRKFQQHPYLRHHLLESNGAILVEASKTDFYWGAGKSMDQIVDTNWTGENVLGRLLMLIRDRMLSKEHISHVKRRIQEKTKKKKSE